MMNVNKTMKHLKDEYYTPFYLAAAFFDAMTEQLYSMAMNKIALNEKLYIWCPFDTEHSSFVAAARKWAKERFGDTWEKVVCVEFSHIALGQDFFWYEPEHWDIAVSNPPFSLKLKIFNKLHKANKPWAMLCNIECLNYQEVGENFYNWEKANEPAIELLIVDKKVSYDGHTAAFNSSFFCQHFISNHIQFIHLPDNNSGAFFRNDSMMAVDYDFIKTKV